MKACYSLVFPEQTLSINASEKEEMNCNKGCYQEASNVVISKKKVYRTIIKKNKSACSYVDLQQNPNILVCSVFKFSLQLHNNQYKPLYLFTKRLFFISLMLYFNFSKVACGYDRSFMCIFKKNCKRTVISCMWNCQKLNLCVSKTACEFSGTAYLIFFKSVY